MSINEMSPRTGRALREDGTTINEANAAVSAGIAAGTKVCTTTASAVAADQPCVEVLCQADPANTVNVLIGDAALQPIALTPGASIIVPVSNVNLIYAKSASLTATLNWLGRL